MDINDQMLSKFKNFLNDLNISVAKVNTSISEINRHSNRLDTEITNRCNAACPQCPRTGTNTGGLSDIMHRSGIYDVPVESFDKILCSAAGLNINKVTYCGNYGDLQPCNPHPGKVASLWNPHSNLSKNSKRRQCNHLVS